MDGFDLPRGDGTTNKAEAQGAHPRPPQRREPRRRADAPGVHPLPQPGRRHACPPRCRRAQRFAQARELVVKHYQWMIRTDYLPRICAPGVVNDVFTNGRKVFEVGADPTDVPTMPIEFSVAAFRLGHSMIRRAYNWNARFDDGSGHARLPVPVLGHERRASAASCGCRATGSPTSAGSTTSARPAAPTSRCPAAKFNRAMRIDTLLVEPAPEPAHGLVRRAVGAVRRPAREPRVPQPHAGAGWSSSRPGSRWPRFLKQPAASTLTTLTEAQIRDGNSGADARRRSPSTQRAGAAQGHAAVVLRPARGRAQQRQAQGRRRADRRRDVPPRDGGQPVSIVRDPAWRPTLGPDSNTFRMVDLLLFAFEGKKSLLAPLG